jgi:O-antigen/teichoic acid export membrane protein
MVLGINFCSTMVLARLIAPAETGLFSVAASAVLLAQAIRDFGVGEFLIQEKHLTPLKIRTAFGMTLALAWALGLLIFTLRGRIAALYGTPELGGLIAVVCGSFLVAPFSSTVLALLNREMAFGVLLRISLASNIANAVVSIGLALIGWGAMALTCGMLAMNVTTAMAAAIVAPSRDHFVPSLKEWRALCSFGACISGANIINQVSARLPDLIIGRLLGYEPLGVYNRANGLVSIFHEMFLSGMQTVAFPAFAAATRAGENLREPYLRAASLISGTALPVLTLIAVVAHPLVLCLLGPAWAGTAELIPPLAACFGLALIAPMTTVFLSATGWIGLIPRIAVALQICQLGTILIGAHFSITGVAIGNIGYGFLNLLINAYYLRKATGITLAALLHAAKKSLAVTLLCAVPAAGVSCLPMLAGHEFLLLGATLAAGAAAWGIAVILLRHPIVNELMLLAQELRRSMPRDKMTYRTGVSA